MKRVSLVLILAVAAGLSIQTAHAQTLKTVTDRGMLSCGVSQGLPGFSAPDDKGNWTGIDVDVCRAIAAAVFNDPTKVKFVPLSAKDRFTALQSGEIDVLSRNTTWTLSRDTSLGANFTGVTYYDGQGFLVKKSLKVNSALELNSASVCVQTGTTTEQNLADYFKSNNMKYEVIAFGTADETVKAYESGRCDVFTSDVSQLYAERLKLANPADHVVLPEVISKEPLGPMVRHGDDQWFDLVKWVLFAMVDAEELGITQKNVDEMAKSDKPELKRVIRHRRQSRRIARRHQGLGVADHQGGRQLRRVLRSQRRRRLQARDRARAQPALEQGRNSIRAADPLIAVPAVRGDDAARPDHRRRSLSPNCGVRSAAAPAGAGLSCRLLFVAALVWIGYEIVANARANLQSQRITSGFGFLSQHCRLRRQPEPDSVFGVGHLYPRIPGRPAQHAAGFRHRHLLRHRHRIPGGAGPAVAELAAGAHFRRLCRTGAQPAGAVPDPVLVSRRARGVAGPRQSVSLFGAFFLNNRGLVIPKPIAEAGLAAFATCHPDRHRRLAGVAQPCAPATVRQRQTDPDLALCGRPAAWIAVAGSAGVWQAGHV